MELIELRELIQARVKHSDIKVLEAIYELLQSSSESNFVLSDEEIKEIELDTLDYLSGKTKGFTLKEVKSNCLI